MKTSTSLKSKLIAIALIPILLAMITIIPMTFATVELSRNNDSSNSSTEILEPSMEAQFAYQIENRPDPFIPFISDKASSSNINEIIPVAEQLSGMQLFEPGQLTLVAIVMAGNGDFAMAEDTTGKGYILQAGMKIGKRGVITAIKSNEVTIEETAFTRAGKKLTSTIVMLLKKEGEE